jgi:hypothetical protein
MRRRAMVMAISLLLVTLFGAGAHAASCKDVKGDWDYSVQGVKAAVAGPSHQFLKAQGTFHITGQQGCAFYGIGDVDENPLVGVIDGKAFVMKNTNGTMLEGTLVSNSTGQVTGMRFMLIRSTSKDNFAAKGTATRH